MQRFYDESRPWKDNWTIWVWNSAPSAETLYTNKWHAPSLVIWHWQQSIVIGLHAYLYYSVKWTNRRYKSSTIKIQSSYKRFWVHNLNMSLTHCIRRLTISYTTYSRLVPRKQITHRRRWQPELIHHWKSTDEQRVPTHLFQSSKNHSMVVMDK